jgi:hypothetical protein
MEVMLMKIYHGTSKHNAENILKLGFNINLSDKQRWGKGIYFTDNFEFATAFGEEVIEVDIPKNEILDLSYEDIGEIYPFLSIEEEEGTPRLRSYVLSNTDYRIVSILYNDGVKEIVAYEGV